MIDVLHVTPYMHPSAGGPPVVVDRLCRQLVARGWKIEVVTTDTCARGEDFGWAEAYRDGFPLSVHASRGPASFGYSSTLRRDIEKRAARSRLVHVHGLWTYPGWCAMRVCRRAGIPYVVMPHGMLDPHSLERKSLKKRLVGGVVEWPNLRSAARMIYTHEEERRLAESTVRGLPRGIVAPLGCDPPPAAPREVLAGEFVAAYPQLRESRLVVFLGRLHPKKGLDLLIPAFAQIVHECPEARLVLVGGGDEAYVEQLHRWIADGGIDRQVVFTGPLSGRAKWAALAAGAVLAVPSYQENFGLVVVEALAVGTPVVLSRRVNLWHDVVSASAGLDCELCPSSLAAALRSYLDDATAAAQSGRQGQQLVGLQFNWPHHAELVEQAYTQILRDAIISNTIFLNPEP